MPTVSMRDVATHAGVSTATVSHVINNTRYVAEETRQRVLDSIHALNYNPNAVARIFRTGRKGIIGFVIPDISNSFFSALVEAVEYVLGQENYRLLLSNSHENISRELENMRMMTSGIVDGVLVASTLRDYSELEDIVPNGFPMVFLDRVISGCPCDVVRVNTYDTVAQATEELIQRGHTRIACSSNWLHISTNLERLTAYQDVMSRHGLQPISISLPVTFDDIAICTDQLLKDNITALIATNGLFAVSCAEYLYQKGLVLGKDIDLVAFQDDEMPHFFYPYSMVIRQPVRELGQAAARQLLWRINHPDQPAREILLQASYSPKLSDPA